MMLSNWRGVYQGGGFVVGSKRWWSRRDRRAARIAAKVLDFERCEIGRLTADQALKLLQGKPAHDLGKWNPAKEND